MNDLGLRKSLCGPQRNILLLVIIPFPFWTDDAPDVLPSLWHRIVPWVASQLSHFSRHQVLASSELYGYFQLLTYVLIAGVATIVWSAVDRKRTANQ